MSRVDEILAFWFGRPGDDEFGAPREAWWKKDPAFDEAIRSRFLADYQRAVAGETGDFADTPDGALALILVLDQFPRNMFRDAARAFAADEQARAVARTAVDAGFDRDMPPILRLFPYLPFEHSECMADQQASVSLINALPEHAGRDKTIESALRHREIIARFGRFPHRNAILGRETTAKEAAFLKEPNSSF